MFIHWKADEDGVVVSLYTTDTNDNFVSRKVALSGKEESFVVEFLGDATMRAHKQIKPI
mgnify:CR=1 FL=1